MLSSHRSWFYGPKGLTDRKTQDETTHNSEIREQGDTTI